jgi:hypothetical protein
MKYATAAWDPKTHTLDLQMCMSTGKEPQKKSKGEGCKCSKKKKKKKTTKTRTWKRKKSTTTTTTTTTYKQTNKPSRAKKVRVLGMQLDESWARDSAQKHCTAKRRGRQVAERRRKEEARRRRRRRDAVAQDVRMCARGCASERNNYAIMCVVFPYFTIFRGYWHLACHPRRQILGD